MADMTYSTHKAIGFISSMKPWDFWIQNDLIGLEPGEAVINLPQPQRGVIEAFLVAEACRLRDAEVNVARAS